METALLDIQKSIYDVLSGDVTLNALITGVFDDVPKDQEFPFITLGTATEVNFNTFSRQGRDITEEVFIWSRHRGFSEGLEILERVALLLDYTTITTTNSLVYIRYEDGDTSLVALDEGRTKQIRGRFRVVVQEP